MVCQIYKCDAHKVKLHQATAVSDYGGIYGRLCTWEE